MGVGLDKGVHVDCAGSFGAVLSRRLNNLLGLNGAYRGPSGFASDFRGGNCDRFLHKPLELCDLSLAKNTVTILGAIHMIVEIETRGFAVGPTVCVIRWNIPEASKPSLQGASLARRR